MADCKPVDTPAVPNLVLSKNGTPMKKEFPYRSLVGNLLYIAKQTRPDILNTVNILSRCLEAPTEEHLCAAVHLLRYLRGTSTIGLAFHSNGQMQLIGAADADFSNDVDDRKSVTGYYFKLKGNGGAISWECRKQ